MNNSLVLKKQHTIQDRQQDVLTHMRSLSNGVGNYNTEYRFYQTGNSFYNCNAEGKEMLTSK